MELALATPVTLTARADFSGEFLGKRRVELFIGQTFPQPLGQFSPLLRRQRQRSIKYGLSHAFGLPDNANRMACQFARL